MQTIQHKLIMTYRREEEEAYELTTDEMSSHPQAVEFLEKNPEKVDWSRLYGNTSAISILERNLDEVCWSLSFTPEYSYQW